MVEEGGGGIEMVKAKIVSSIAIFGGREKGGRGKTNRKGTEEEAERRGREGVTDRKTSDS